MKTNLKNGALTFAFTIAGACLGYVINYHPLTACCVLVLAGIGGFSAALNDED